MLLPVVCGVLLLASCRYGEVPFPDVPNLPTDYNLGTTYANEMTGAVSMFTCQTIHEYSDGIVSQQTACFDTAGHCLHYYYRDSETCRHLAFVYDTTGKRIEERSYLDTAGTSFDSLTRLHTLTVYSYSRSGRTCRARITGPDGRRHTFRLRYDKQGRLKRFVYPDGSRFSYDYDNDGHLVRRTWPDASFERYQYDSTGQLASTTGRDGVIVWHIPLPPPTSIDSLGRVLEQVVGNAGTDSHDPIRAYYRYDDHGNWTRRTTTSLSTPTRIDIRTFKYYNPSPSSTGY